MSMSENEAIKNINALNAVCGQKDFYDEKFEKSLEMAIKALSEIQQYRAIGTVEEIEKSMQNVSVLLAEHELLKLYQAIGTIDEFKALKEKNEPKRLLTKWEMYPTNHGVYSSADRWCPSCKNLVFDGDWSISKQKMMYNRHRCECGQVLDWR